MGTRHLQSVEFITVSNLSNCHGGDEKDAKLCSLGIWDKSICQPPLTRSWGWQRVISYLATLWARTGFPYLILSLRNCRVKEDRSAMTILAIFSGHFLGLNFTCNFVSSLLPPMLFAAYATPNPETLCTLRWFQTLFPFCAEPSRDFPGLNHLRGVIQRRALSTSNR